MITGKVNGVARTGFAGLLNVSIDGGPQTEAYCIDINTQIVPGDMEPHVSPDYPCEVTYILGSFYPNGPVVLTDASNNPAPAREAAAVQGAIWFFTDGAAITSPADVKARTLAIIATAENHCAQVSAVPMTITVSPASATNVLPGDTTHTVTLTLTDTNGDPVPNYPVSISITGVSGPQAFAKVTDGQGQVQVTYTNPGVPGTDTITASATFATPLGLKFKAQGKQAIVLAGEPQTGIVKGSATKTWIQPRCGDGIVQTNEECDDDNVVNNDACRNDCHLPKCGDGIVQTGEQCDDGNQVNNDACTNNCHLPKCGDGIVQTGEQCDDGNQVNTDNCSNACKLPRCGDGIVNQTSEQCDDGNQVNTDACTNDCRLPKCGDGIVQAGEQCDDGNTINTDNCSNACKLPRCGDGIVNLPSEQCDDGNQVSNDACSNDCKLPRCGDGIVQGTEQCDDGNTQNDDACTNDCRKHEVCTNFVDDDMDGLIDCDDPDCPCPPFKKDPAKINIADAGPDFLHIFGVIDTDASFDPVRQPIVFGLLNAKGVIQQWSVPAGSLQSLGGGKFLFSNPNAGSTHDKSVARVEIRPFRRQAGRFMVQIDAYGDLSGVNDPYMTAEIVIGDGVWATHAKWKKSGNHWTFH